MSEQRRMTLEQFGELRDGDHPNYADDPSLAIMSAQLISRLYELTASSQSHIPDKAIQRVSNVEIALPEQEEARIFFETIDVVHQFRQLRVLALLTLGGWTSNEADKNGLFYYPIVYSGVLKSIDPDESPLLKELSPGQVMCYGPRLQNYLSDTPRVYLPDLMDIVREPSFIDPDTGESLDEFRVFGMFSIESFPKIEKVILQLYQLNIYTLWKKLVNKTQQSNEVQVNLLRGIKRLGSPITVEVGRTFLRRKKYRFL